MSEAKLDAALREALASVADLTNEQRVEVLLHAAAGLASADEWSQGEFDLTAASVFRDVDKRSRAS